jgi:hypothetical protein
VRIIAECSACAWRYDATKGLECPHCLGTGVRWASREPDPYEIIDQLREHFLETPFPPDKDLAELQRIWALTEYNPAEGAL